MLRAEIDEPFIRGSDIEVMVAYISQHFYPLFKKAILDDYPAPQNHIFSTKFFESLCLFYVSLAWEISHEVKGGVASLRGALRKHMVEICNSRFKVMTDFGGLFDSVIWDNLVMGCQLRSVLSPAEGAQQPPRRGARANPRHGPTGPKRK